MEAIYGEMEVESCYTLLELPSPKKKRKSKGSVENSDKPKKPRSAYLLYYFDVHQRIQQEHPDLPQSEINKCISDSWKRLNVADRGYYLERARMERDGVDPSSQSAAVSSQDVPGFRKILPRANYVLLPKSPTAGDQTEGGDVDVLVDGAPGTPAQDTLVSPMNLGSEVELTEQCIAIQALSADAAQNTSICERVTSLDKTVKKKETGVCYADVAVAVENGGDAGALMPQLKAESTHLVAIIPNQGLVENKVINTASPIMMFPLMSTVKTEPKPSFKLPIKYTRRGRGNCITPGCMFSYVTRHKPPFCPDCGQHLGGKWVPHGKRSSSKSSEASSGKECEDSNPTAQRSDDPVDLKDTEQTEDHASASRVSTSDKAQDGGSAAAAARRVTRKKRERIKAGSTQQTSDGAAVCKPDETTAVLALGGGQIQIIAREKACSAVQKRRIRAILPAPSQNNSASQPAVMQWITIPPDKVKTDAGIIRAVKVSEQHMAGLKPSTLKQLGHMITPAALQQKPMTVNSNQYIITDNGVKILSMVPFKKSTGSSLALGLSTARGRGRCKNPACDYVYKNRHKPQQCPTCGCELVNKSSKKSKLTCSEEESAPLLLEPSACLSVSQKEQQRQSTVSLMRSCLQFPESETELQDVFSLIQELNASENELQESSGWPNFYEPAATHCSLCQQTLYKGEQGSVAGLEDCWLLTERSIRVVTLQLKVCTNLQCLAIHSFTDLYPGLFNVGNKLLVTLDLFFKMRNQIRLGDEPAQAALSIITNAQTDGVFSSDQTSRIQELFCSGFWAFECLTLRDYNDMICGICGIAPKLEIAQRSATSVLQLKHVEFTWPDFPAPDEVHVDEFWLTMENEALEQAAFPSSVPITRLDASIIAPFIPPLMRNTTVINTEKNKILNNTHNTGDVAALVHLIHEGRLIPDQLHLHTEEELRDLLEKCALPAQADTDKADLLASLTSLYTQTQSGLWTADQPEDLLTAGRITKVCPHQVVCGSKYIVRRESARDHLDLLLSSRFWPPVYVADCAQKVALCADVSYPQLAKQMWGENQGCFSDPTAAPQYVSCSELQDQPYSLDLTVTDSNPQLHPLTKSTSRWMVRPDTPTSTLQDAHYNISLCRELEPYVSLSAQICEPNNHKPTQVFQNAAYYYLYNRLLDFLSSRDIVNQQITDVLSSCQPGEVLMIRDALYRLGIAHVNTEQEDEEEEDGGHAHTDGVVELEELMLV